MTRLWADQRYKITFDDYDHCTTIYKEIPRRNLKEAPGGIQIEWEYMTHFYSVTKRGGRRKADRYLRELQRKSCSTKSSVFVNIHGDEMNY